MAIRITGGKYRGFRLSPTPGRIRPTAAVIRQAIFDILGNIEGLSFADLYAGTAAVGIEALSRGAGYVEFVESDRRAVKIIGESLKRLDLPLAAALLPEAARIRPVRVGSWISSGEKKFDIVFADPPYIQTIVNKLIVAMPLLSGRLMPEGEFILQLSANLDPPPGFDDKRVYGENVLYFWDNSLAQH